MKRLEVGYTLIELLMVMLIISIVATISILSLHQNDQREVEALATLIEDDLKLASDEAVLRALPYGFSVVSNRLEFYVYQQGWQRLTEGPLRPHRIPDHLSIQGINDRNIQLIIPPTGDLPHFQILLEKKGRKPTQPLYQLTESTHGFIFQQKT